MPTSVRRVDLLAFTELKGFSPFFHAYCYDFEQLAPFFDGNFRDSRAQQEKVQQVHSASRPRQELVRILLRQQAVWGMDEPTRINIEALGEPHTLAVVTGQQIGLFGGPLYTLYKAITTVQLAHTFSRQLQQPVVPIFWLEDEDHDFEEIASTYILHQHEPLKLSYRPSELPANPGPVGRLRIEPHIEDLYTQLHTIWGDRIDDLLDQLRQCYQPGTTLRDAFARWLKKLLPETGLVFLSPDDAEIKQLCRPLFRKALEDEDTLYAHLEKTSRQLASTFHAQVAPRKTNFFLLTPRGRYALQRENGTYRLKGTTERLTRDELFRLLEKHPEQFSPNVIMRPLMQDYLLPTFMYVAGPSEIAYFAQFKPLYRHLGIPMPLVYPRASATMIEAPVQRILEKYDIEFPELQGDVEALYRHLIVERYGANIEQAFTRTDQQIRRALDELLPLLSTLDPTLLPAAKATQKRVFKELEKLKNKAIRAEKQKHQEVLQQLQRAQYHLFPLGKLQERVLSPLYFLSAVGFDFSTMLRDTLSTETCMHQLVYL